MDSTWTPRFEFDEGAKRSVAPAYTTSLENSNACRNVRAALPAVLGRGTTAIEAMGAA